MEFDRPFSIISFVDIFPLPFLIHHLTNDAEVQLYFNAQLLNNLG